MNPDDQKKETSIDPKKVTEFFKQMAAMQAQRPAVFNQFNGGQAKRAEYEAKLTSRVSVPILSANSGRGTIEMTTETSINDQIQFTILLSGRQSLDFTIHRKDVEALLGQVTLATLAK